MPRESLKHKILCVAEEQGAEEAGYALKLLQSEGTLRMASVGRDSQTGRQQTQHYEVEGPVAMLLTTTAEVPDTELANRCITLSVCERPEQTATIHQRQRSAYLPQADQASDQAQPEAVQLLHQQAQRLLEPLPVVIPFADQLTFRTDQVRYRRDHAKYLALIASITLLRQYQRKRITRHGETCVVATRDDARLANQLTAATFGLRGDELLPHTQQLLETLARFVMEQAQLQGTGRAAVRFTQRQLREKLCWSDRSLRRQLSRLVQLEYVLVYRTRRGNQREYQLLYDPHASAAPTWQLGLCALDTRTKRERPQARHRAAAPEA